MTMMKTLMISNKLAIAGTYQLVVGLLSCVTAAVKLIVNHHTRLKRAFHQRKVRNGMTSLLDRPITAAIQQRRRKPLARCQAAADTREIIEIKFLICIVSWTASKKPARIWTTDFFLQFSTLNSNEFSSVPIGWSLRLLR